MPPPQIAGPAPADSSSSPSVPSFSASSPSAPLDTRGGLRVPSLPCIERIHHIDDSAEECAEDRTEDRTEGSTEDCTESSAGDRTEDRTRERAENLRSRMGLLIEGQVNKIKLIR